MVFPSLDCLSTELLLKIFQCLDIIDLCRLNRTCRRFREVLETWAHNFIRSEQLLVTNLVHDGISERSTRYLSRFERLRISRNWKLGVYNEKSLLYTKVKYIPWLQLDKEVLWLSRGSFIVGYQRTGKGIYAKEPLYCFNGPPQAEICRFVLRDSHIFSGQTDGSLYLISPDSKKVIFKQKNCHEADINSVDMLGDVLASGSRDNLVKIWKKPTENFNQNILHSSIDLLDRVWSVSLNENDRSLLAIGTAGNSSVSTISVFDIVNHNFVTKLGLDRLGAGVLDLKWESPSVLWSCGYDATIRRWDLRTGDYVQTFDDPCGAVIYCFQYDHFNTILAGTQSNGRVVLWDTRNRNYAQMYFMESCRRKENSSPVYGLSFDAEFLFTVTDQHLNVLNFSVLNGKFRDYSNLFLNLI